MSGLFGSTTIKGTRITDFAQTSATVGVPIPKIYGRAPSDGNVIFAPLPPKENRTVKRQGKGGVKQESFTYTLSYAIAFCQGPIYGYWWIKRNGKVVWTNDPAAPIEDAAYAAKWAQKATFYYGTASQLPDSTIESYKGTGAVSAFHYLAYIVVEDDDVTDNGGAVPSYEAVPIATPSEVYFTSKPYPQHVIDKSETGFASAGGSMRSMVVKGRFKDAAETGFASSGGHLHVWVPPYMVDEVETGFAASGGKLDLPPWGQFKDKVTTGFAPSGGTIFNPPLGDFEDAVETGFAPTGGELSGTPTPPEPSSTVFLVEPHGSTGGSTSLVDLSGHVLLSSGNGAAITTSNPPVSGGASLLFDVTNKYWQGDTFASIGSSDFTYQAWIYITSVTTAFTIIDTRYWGNNDGMLFAVSNGARPVFIEWRPSAGTGSPGGDGGGSVPLNTWTHVAATREGSTWRFYVDGVKVRQISAPGMIFSTSLCRIGRVNDNNDSYTARGQIGSIQVDLACLYSSDSFTPPLPPWSL